MYYAPAALVHPARRFRPSGSTGNLAGLEPPRRDDVRGGSGESAKPRLLRNRGFPPPWMVGRPELRASAPPRTPIRCRFPPAHRLRPWPVPHASGPQLGSGRSPRRQTAGPLSSAHLITWSAPDGRRTVPGSFAPGVPRRRSPGRRPPGNPPGMLRTRSPRGARRG